MATKEVRKTLSYEFDGSVLTISDDERTLRRFDFDIIPTELDEQFMALGRKTKLANFAASAKAEGRDRLEMIDEGWEQLKSGVWEKEREGGGPTVSAEVEALAALKGVSVAAIQKKLREYDKETRAKILSNDRVKAKAEEIKRERAEDATNLDDMV